ncbi:MAG: glucoamylase family protein [Gemmatimonadota bacterium]
MGVDHLAERARTLAAGQTLAPGRTRERQALLLARLDQTRRILADSEAQLADAAARGVDVGPAGAWLLDNYHVVEEHMREVRQSLPRGFYSELPQLSSGPLAGYPRVYELAITLISHTEARIDLENVNLFIAAFQAVRSLSIGELWAIPAMLRLGLIESVRRMSLRTVERLAQVEDADRRAAGILSATERSDQELAAAVAEFKRDPPRLTSIFVARFLHSLRESRAAHPVLIELEQWIGVEGVRAELASIRSTQRVAITQIMMANSITSLRAVGRLDWKVFVERQSVMDAVLRTDPAAFYKRMTFATRDHYRHVVERIAKRKRLTETEVAAHAIRLASRPEMRDHRAHVGYYLVDEGLPELEAACGFKAKGTERLHRFALRHPIATFASAILGLTALLVGAVWLIAGPIASAALVLTGALLLIPTTDVAINLANQLFSVVLPPRMLPKLDLRGAAGIPAEFRTAVVIPTLFADVDDVAEAMETIESQFLANREAHLHFAVLSDFTDAASETGPGDSEILAAAVSGINELNRRYTPETGDAFFLFHRPRRWNPGQGVWMGWERKRGKLSEFNHYLRGGARDAFSTVIGKTDVLQHVRYVITLDADTVLPPDSAPLLVGALAHPLNRAVHDVERGRVVRGFSILQPRVGVSLPSAHRSRFAAINSGHPGVDPYTTAVSDVYQDLFGEGSFTGKGIYDVDAFERATRGRFPENKLLSHDLIEGSYARAGLVTDIILYDDYPTRYLTYTRRKHRWIRGDWQLLDWLTPKVPGIDGPERNRLSMLSRWKIFDNLRRSTVEVGQLALLIGAWTLLPGSVLTWTMLALGAIAAPWLVSLLLAVLRPPLDKSWTAYYSAVARDARTSLQQMGITIAFLPHQAWISIDAIARTLWRIAVSKKQLLEWQTASGAERALPDSPLVTWKAMRPQLLIALAVGVPVSLTVGSGARSVLVLLVSAPFILLWLTAPALANALVRPPAQPTRELPEEHRARALRYALLHWRFFDRFVGSKTNGLVPDNYQEDPLPVTALRTSPTNIGLQLLSTVSAYDLGFITVEDMAARLELAFRALERMDRFHGHFYNWYDLEDLRVLNPGYISTVDSGNLAGHLIALRQALLAIRQQPAVPRNWAALDTGLELAEERLLELATAGVGGGPQAWQSVRMAQSLVQRARVALADAAQSTSATASLATIVAPLHAAQQVLSAAREFPGIQLDAREWIDWCITRIEAETLGPGAVAAQLEVLAARAYEYATKMDFRFLYDSSRKLFAIGYHPDSHSRDASYYDLLASEARLASFIAIAKNDVAVEHWFHLGRTLTYAARNTALVSWSGSMFEYLMPSLVMRSWPHTLLDHTYRGALYRQIAHGRTHRVPWGMSESAYAVRDRHATYQYRAFGVADLGLKHGLDRELVIAPYASMLALMVEPGRAITNLSRLEKKGALGAYGFRDALDYTRAPADADYTIVRTYMAHHIGMSFLALTNTLLGNIWPARFHADPIVRATELLLHERIPRRLVLQAVNASAAPEVMPEGPADRPIVREFERPDTFRPHVALLGQLPYTIMVSHCGAGYSRFEDLAVTRWRSDATTDNLGQYCYIKDLTRGEVWSAAHQPVCRKADWYRAVFATDRVTFHRADGDIETRTEIAIVPEDSAEVRRVTVTNNGEQVREVELTSYGEVVLAPPEAERAHPAFANLFVETEYHEWCNAITATRRPRSAGERPLVCVHVVATGKQRIGEVTCETDRARFIGRGRSTRDPAALHIDGALSGTTGAVLDPIFALRTRVRLRAGESAFVAFTTLVAPTRKRAFDLADRYHTLHASQRALDLAWTSTQVELRELDIPPADAIVFQELAGHLLYSSKVLGPTPADRAASQGSQPLLWSIGVSGDRPILLASLDSPEGLPTLRQLYSAHHYWRRRGLHVDLVVVNEQAATYLHELDDKIAATLAASTDAGLIDQPGGVFLRRHDVIAEDAFRLLRATARVIIRCDGSSLGHILDAATQTKAAQVAATEAAPTRAAERQELRVRHSHPAASPASSREAGHGDEKLVRRRSQEVFGPDSNGARALLFDNGVGGIGADGDYYIRVRSDFGPPAPWSNVIANPHGGFLVTERGAGFTWAGNSYFYRLTPWHNDPVSDPPGDALYLQDESTGALWSPTPAPVSTGASYLVRHGAGSSTFDHTFEQIRSVLTLAMAQDATVRISSLRLSNLGKAQRTIRLTAYVEWTLGVLREQTQHHVRTAYRPEQSAIFATNTFDPQFANWSAFCALSEPITAQTADRKEFLGRNGTIAHPRALRGGQLSGAIGTGLDPCAALQCGITLAPGESRDVVILLGAADSESAAAAAIDRYRRPASAIAAVDEAVAAWADRLSHISVRTPDPAFDAMMNQWALYQALACRMWARTGFYQSSGAYGFRDQLQDVMAFVYAEPAVSREHILRAAERQFVEGDVQHWWHPQSGRGVRTRFSDDLAWLPYVTDHYVRVTGDAGVLNEQVPFLSMRLLEPEEHEVYDLPAVSTETGSVYEHCLRALRKACTHGEHDLPLIGTGDWNDGMNRVGAEGRGESVWLGWFLITTLRAFARIAEQRGDTATATVLRAEAERYVTAVETSGWDGDWYRRAYFDDGTPLGSAQSDECRIDAIAQSWSVISGAGTSERQQQAMASLEQYLIRDDDRIIRLLTPPFDKTEHDPGYIKGYLPGVRENGAQYTHAALWTVLATALQGDDDRAFELFQMINPLTRTDTPEGIQTYKVEPYVVAADVYTAKGQLGRGGWTWYTGSASWLYRIGLEAILGFAKRGESLVISPHAPAAWPEYSISYHYGRSTYNLIISHVSPGETSRPVLDGVPLDDDVIQLVDDGQVHTVRITRSAGEITRRNALGAAGAP